MNLKWCAIKVVERLNLDAADLKTKLFNDLHHQEDIEAYDYFLTLQGDLYLAKFLNLIAELGQRNGYGVQRDFLALTMHFANCDMEARSTGIKRL